MCCRTSGLDFCCYSWRFFDNCFIWHLMPKWKTCNFSKKALTPYTYFYYVILISVRWLYVEIFYMPVQVDHDKTAFKRSLLWVYSQRSKNILSSSNHNGQMSCFRSNKNINDKLSKRQSWNNMYQNVTDELGQLRSCCWFFLDDKQHFNVNFDASIRHSSVCEWCLNDWTPIQEHPFAAEGWGCLLRETMCSSMQISRFFMTIMKFICIWI